MGAQETINAHPDEAFLAGLALCRSALAAIAAEMPASLTAKESLEISLILQESITEQIGRYSMSSYSNFLLTKIHEAQLAERRRFSRDLPRGALDGGGEPEPRAPRSPVGEGPGEGGEQAAPREVLDTGAHPPRT